MPLSDIKNKLYEKENSEKNSEYDLSEYNPKIKSASIKEISPDNKDLWTEKKALGSSEKKAIKIGMLSFFGLILIILIILGIFKYRQSMFNESNASVSIIGPDRARSGKLLTYEINYINNNKVDIENAVLKLSYPENFKPDGNQNFKEESQTSGSFNLGKIAKKSQGKIVFNGKAYIPKGALIYIKGDLFYNPRSFSGQFGTSAQIGVHIDSAPIILELQAPQNISSGDAVDYLIICKNDGAEALEGLSIKVEYPEEFVFSTSEPKASESNNIWNIGDLAPGESKKIVASGRLEGEKEKIKTVKAYVGTVSQGIFLSYNEENADTKIISSPLSLSQTVNEKKDLNVNAGDSLVFLINYKNNGNIGLRDVILTEKIESPVLDYASLETRGGGFDVDTKTITWKASNIKEFKNLAPGQSGSVSFKVKVKDIFPISSKTDKNFVISSLAKIDSPDVPTPISMNKIISSNQMNVKVNSKLVLDVKGYYKDSNIPNSGPLPPKVGQETTYTIHWKVMNVSNDVGGAKVMSTLPGGVQMTGKIFPENARLNYNERTNSVIWDIGNISAGTGITSDPLEVSFQVKIKPSPSQAGGKVVLLNKSTFSAKDFFTNDNLEITEDEKDNALREDEVAFDKSKVEE